jgi:hypothetical protein
LKEDEVEVGRAVDEGRMDDGTMEGEEEEEDDGNEEEGEGDDDGDDGGEVVELFCRRKSCAMAMPRTAKARDVRR